MIDGEPMVGGTHYEVLGVPLDADRQQIARAYRAAMRVVHPDVGAGAGRGAVVDDVFAVQEAWRVLGDPAARAAYDHELSSPADAWADLGWGVGLDDPVPAPDDGRPPPRTGPGVDEEFPRDVDDTRDEPWRAPFAPGAVHIPEPVLPLGPPRRDAIDRVLTAAGVVLTIATVVLGSRAWGSELSSDSSPFGISMVTAAIIFVAVLLTLPISIFGVRNDERGSPERAVAVVGCGVSPVCIVGAAWSLGAVPTILGSVTFGAGAMWIAADLRRARVVEGSETARVASLTVYHGAVEWNRIREALRAPGARAEQSQGAPCLDEPLRVRTEDPVTHETTMRDVPVAVPRGGWLVVDDVGSVLCTAPPGALEAWLSFWPDVAATPPPEPSRL